MRKIYTRNPFSYNYISLNQSRVNKLPTPSTQEVVVNPVYNAVGKAFGIKDPHMWPKMSDKIFLISEWAKERSGYQDPKNIVGWLEKKTARIKSLGAEKIDNLYNKIRNIEQ